MQFLPSAWARLLSCLCVSGSWACCVLISLSRSILSWSSWSCCLSPGAFWRRRVVLSARACLLSCLCVSGSWACCVFISLSRSILSWSSWSCCLSPGAVWRRRQHCRGCGADLGEMGRPSSTSWTLSGHTGKTSWMCVHSHLQRDAFTDDALQYTVGPIVKAYPGKRLHPYFKTTFCSNLALLILLSKWKPLWPRT